MQRIGFSDLHAYHEFRKLTCDLLPHQFDRLRRFRGLLERVWLFDCDDSRSNRKARQVTVGDIPWPVALVLGSFNKNYIKACMDFFHIHGLEAFMKILSQIVYRVHGIVNMLCL